MDNMKKKNLAIAVSIACVSGSLSAVAQNSMALEEVVVVAQKRAQSLQDVPIAVQALSADMLKQNGITTLSDISTITPGFKMADSQGVANVTALRGVNSFAFGFGLEESVPLYLDGVYLGNGFDMLGDLLDIRQIEILKGPQGTLFGRNASAGAVNVITNPPTNDFEATVGVGAGNYNLYTTRGLVNVPIIEDVLMVRGGFSTRNRNGWQTNVITEKEDGFEQDRSAGFVRALWVASDSLDIEYSGDYSRQKDHSGYLSVNTVRTFQSVWNQADPASFYDGGNEKAASGNEGVSISAAGGALQIPLAPAEATKDIIQDRKIIGNAFKATWDMNEDMTLTAITSYRKADTKTGFDADGGNFGLVNSWSTGTTKEFNQEFRLNVAWDSVDWMTGVNYYNQDRSQKDTTYLSSLLSLQRVGLSAQDLNITETSAGDNETEAYSVFGDATWHLTDALNLTAGLRYSYDEKTFKLNDSNNDTFMDNGLVYPNYDQLPDPSTHSWDDNWDNLSGRVGVDYTSDDDVMLFATISQGYKSGGFNTRLTVDGTAESGYVTPAFALAPFDEEKNINYEIGVKSELMDGRMRFNSSVFYYVYKDLQILLAEANLPVARTVNASEVTGYGWDSEIVYLATEDLTFSANFLALNAEYTEDVVDQTGTVRFEKGSKRPWSPDWAGTIAMNYVIDLGDTGELRTNLTYSYRDDQLERGTQVTEIYTNEDNSQKGYGLLNGRVTFYTADEHWEVALWGKNILDEDYRNNINASANSVAGVLTTVQGEPATYGLEATYNF